MEPTQAHDCRPLERLRLGVKKKKKALATTSDGSVISERGNWRKFVTLGWKQNKPLREQIYAARTQSGRTRVALQTRIQQALEIMTGGPAAVKLHSACAVSQGLFEAYLGE